MTTSLDRQSPVHLKAVTADNQPPVTPALEDLYRGFEKELLVPLWTEIGDLMPVHPRSKALPHLWRWDSLRALAAQAGELVPVGRGGERRAIALANPGLNGRPFATPTLWAAIQDGASTVDFDFWSWGMAKYERAVAEFGGSDFGRLLEEVTADI